jgi:alkylation response protein AidB-like acyl-CoA dehydrogenase
MVVAVGMSEPDAGSALTDLTTSARIEGDRVILNGNKRWCSGGGHADGYVIYCRFDDQPGARASVLSCREGRQGLHLRAAGKAHGLPRRTLQRPLLRRR